ncbi:acetyltransferase (GNAT) family protein [Lachnospiraceae bacterium TWA4]|nr:acetyltransferase (GNAT) family protein [Lachnospiraceae bacterium TWA4]
MNKKFEFRTIKLEEISQAVVIEQICFPPNEACSEKSMNERMKVAADFCLVAVDTKTGKIAGFLNGLATDEEVFRDEFFTDASLHNPNGANVMLLGLDVLPEYRHQGLAHEIVSQYKNVEARRGRKSLILTCLEDKVKFYEGMEFLDLGISNSTWGGEQWHDMSYKL